MKPRQLVFLLLGVGLWLRVDSAATAEEFKEVTENPSAQFHGGVGSPQPIIDLPDHVPAAEGQVTLWADFGKADETGVPLYLVNQTNQNLSFGSQDRDLYIKLEHKKADDHWARAQAHRSSWCGNSYFPIALPARQFFAFRGYRAVTGDKTTVRYAMRNKPEIVSNTGEGLVSKEDLQAVALDSITAGEIPWGFTQPLQCREDAPLPDTPSLRQRTDAVEALAWFPRNEPAVRHAMRLQSKVEALPSSPDRDALLNALRRFFANLDKPKPDGEQRVQLCIDRIAGQATADSAMPLELAWRLLTVPSPSGPALSAPAQNADPRRWKDVIGPAVSLIEHDEKAPECATALAILGSPWIVDALVEDEELEKWFLSSATRLQSIGAFGLSRRSKFERLTKLAWNLPGAQQVIALKALARANADFDNYPLQIRQPDFSADEPDFWEHCVRTMPVESASALWAHTYERGYNPFNRIVHDPLRDHFKLEAERGKEDHDLGGDTYALETALRMLASWQLPEDDPVWRALLAHGGFKKQEGWRGDDSKRFVKKKYIVREAAKQALLKRGQPVPTELVTETEVE